MSDADASRWTAARWTAARAEHDAAIAMLLDVVHRLPAEAWHRADDGRWSPSAVVEHVRLAYVAAVSAVRDGTAMRLRVAPPVAWLARTLLLPIILRRDRFPRGAEAPREVRPDVTLAATRSRDEATALLRAEARDAADALRDAAMRRPMPRIAHAYFGALRPLTAQRLISAHTRHHARLLSSSTRSA